MREEDLDELIDRALGAARELTGLELAYLTRVHEGLHEVARTTDAPTDVRVSAGMRVPLEETYCQRVIDGRLPQVVPDTLAHPVSAALPATADANIGAYLAVPIRLTDGRLYGTICCAASDAHETLGEHELEMVRMLARLIGDQLERAEREHELAQAQRDVLAALAHDLRTPLHAIGLLADDLRGGDGADAAETGRLIRDEVGRVAGLVDDLLLVTIHRVGELRLRTAPADLAAACEEIVAASRPAAARAGVALRLAAPEPVVAEVDATRIRQALRNLLDNALKYSPDGGEVVAEVARDGDDALIAVRDHGIGIAAEDLERLGERYFRARSSATHAIDGTGIGLATVQAVCEAHGGALDVSSELGRGSTFRLRLPLHRAAA